MQIMLKFINYDVHYNCFTIFLRYNKIHYFGVIRLYSNNDFDYKTNARNDIISKNNHTFQHEFKLIVNIQLLKG